MGGLPLSEQKQRNGWGWEQKGGGSEAGTGREMGGETVVGT